MGALGIAIGGAAALALACASAIVWVGTRPAAEEIVHEGVLLSRPALDGLVVSVKDQNFSCPHAVHGELIELERSRQGVSRKLRGIKAGATANAVSDYRAALLGPVRRAVVACQLRKRA